VVAAFIADFKAALWHAIAAEFPDITTKGCILHYSYATWHKVQQVGLQTDYVVKWHQHKFAGIYTNSVYLHIAHQHTSIRTDCVG